jgi:hypothetical protein
MNRIRRLLTAFILPGAVVGVMVGSALSASVVADTVTRQLATSSTSLAYSILTTGRSLPIRITRTARFTVCASTRHSRSPEGFPCPWTS